MIDSILTAALTLCLGIGGALAIGSTFIDADHAAGALQARQAVASSQTLAKEAQRDAAAPKLARSDRVEVVAQ